MKIQMSNNIATLAVLFVTKAKWHLRILTNIGSYSQAKLDCHARLRYVSDLLECVVSSHSYYSSILYRC